MEKASTYEKTLVFNDVHIPFENAKALNLMLQVGKDLDPDQIVINGDLVDMYEISRYVKNPKIKTGELHYEIDRARGFLKDLRHLFPKAKIVYIYGNHEYRWTVNIAMNFKEAHKLRGMTLEEQLGLVEFETGKTSKLNIETVFSGNKESSWLYGKLLIGHFDRVNKHSGYTAKNLLEDKSISLIQGHVHRGGSSFRRLYDRDIVAYENFCLCDREPGYVDRPNWQLGFSIVYKDKHSDYFYVEPHSIAEIADGKRRTYKTWFNGRVYSI